MDHYTIERIEAARGRGVSWQGCAAQYGVNETTLRQFFAPKPEPVAAAVREVKPGAYNDKRGLNAQTLAVLLAIYLKPCTVAELIPTLPPSRQGAARRAFYRLANMGLITKSPIPYTPRRVTPAGLAMLEAMEA